MARANVPKFGNWENEDNVPYTVYFDTARKNKGGKIINPNDPQQNPDTDPRTTRSQDSTVKPVNQQRGSRDDAEYRLPGKSPARGEYLSQRPGNESNYGGRGHRPVRASAGGSEHSLERSPLHPHHHPKLVASSNASPAWDGKTHDNSHANQGQGRSRLRPAARGDESPDAGAAVPKFGQWDENDPSSAENFTDIFEKVREERNAGGGNVLGTPKHPSYNTRGQQSNRSKKCCFL